MTTDPSSRVTVLLEHIRAGDPGAEAQLFELVHDEVHRLANRLVPAPGREDSPQPGSLINEAWLRLVPGGHLLKLQSRAHLIATFVQAMRQIIVDRARRRKAAKRGGDRRRLAIDALLDSYEDQRIEVDRLHEALGELMEQGEQGRRACRIIELHFFGAFSLEQVAEILGDCVSSIRGDWRYARAWLHRRLSEGGSDDG